jgi:hypothetical protein
LALDWPRGVPCVLRQLPDLRRYMAADESAIYAGFFRPTFPTCTDGVAKWF